MSADAILPACSLRWRCSCDFLLLSLTLKSDDLDGAIASALQKKNAIGDFEKNGFDCDEGLFARHLATQNR